MTEEKRRAIEETDRQKREGKKRFVGSSDPASSEFEVETPMERAHREQAERERQALAEARARGDTLSIYDDPPSYWYTLLLYVADSPLDLEPLRHMPLLDVLACADYRARQEQQEAKLTEAAFSAGNPMAGLFGRGKGRRGRR